MLRYFMSVAMFAVAGLVALFVCLPAHAADTPPAAVSSLVAVLAPSIEAVASGVILALIGWIGAGVQRYLGIRIEASHREALHSAAMTGVRQALVAIEREAKTVPFDLHNELMNKAVQWMIGSVPDAIAFFGLDDGQLEKLAQSKLTELMASSGVNLPAEAQEA